MPSAGAKQPTTIRFRPDNPLIDAEAQRLAEELIRRGGGTIPQKLPPLEEMLVHNRASPPPL